MKKNRVFVSIGGVIALACLSACLPLARRGVRFFAPSTYYSWNGCQKCEPSSQAGVSPSEALVVLDNTESLRFNEYVPSDFGINGDCDIDDLTSSFKTLIQEKRYIQKNGFKRILRIRDRSGSFSDEMVEAIRNTYFVESVELIGFAHYCSAPNDPLYPVSPNSNPASYQYYLHKIDLASAWDYQTGSSSVVIGVIDSGIYTAHEDLNASRFPTTYAYDAAGQGRDPFTDAANHGTRVAGIIAATTNNTGIAGICQNVQIASIRADDPNDPDHNESVSTIISGINQAQAWGLPIVNWSGGFSNESTALKTAIKNYTGLLVVAAGNNGYDITSGNNGVTYPSRWRLKNVISVGSSDINDNPAYSNYGSSDVHLFAPGASILSTSNASTSSYSSGDGTSFAAPQVAAAAALILSDRPSAPVVDIKKTIVDNAEYASSLSPLCISLGRLNLKKCLQYPKTHTTHSYTYEVLSHSSTQHENCCECGAYTLSDHVFDSYVYATTVKHKKTCSACGYYQLENHVWDGGNTWFSGYKEYGTCAFCNHSFVLN